MLWHNWATGIRGRGHRQWDVMKNGLYSIHVTLLDGRVGKVGALQLAGVLVVAVRVGKRAAH